MDQFDAVSQQYKEFVEQDPFRNHLHYPGVLKHLELRSGDLVLDIGCGDGYFDELLVRRFNVEVVGYDSGVRQIHSAKAREIEGATFQVASPETFETSQKFMSAVSILVLPYATDSSHLVKFFKSAFTHLHVGGKFLSAVFNPDFENFGREIGSRIFEKLDERTVRVNFLVLPEKRIAFPSQLKQFSREVYESSALDAGFTQLEWVDFKSDAKGLENYGADFWEIVPAVADG